MFYCAQCPGAASGDALQIRFPEPGSLPPPGACCRKSTISPITSAKEAFVGCGRIRRRFMASSTVFTAVSKPIVLSVQRYRCRCSGTQTVLMSIFQGLSAAWYLADDHQAGNPFFSGEAACRYSLEFRCGRYAGSCAPVNIPATEPSSMRRNSLPDQAAKRNPASG